MQILAKTELLNALNTSMITQGNVNKNSYIKVTLNAGRTKLDFVL